MMGNLNIIAPDENYGEWDFGRGSPEPGLQSPAGSSGASGADLRMATTRRNSSNPTSHAATPANALPGLQQEAIDGELNSQAADAAPVRRRKKWTAEVNKFLMRTYYKVSKLETDMLYYTSLLLCSSIRHADLIRLQINAEIKLYTGHKTPGVEAQPF